jgi:hypothetical protein
LFGTVKIERQDQRLECLHAFARFLTGSKHLPIAVTLTLSRQGEHREPWSAGARGSAKWPSGPLMEPEGAKRGGS